MKNRFNDVEEPIHTERVTSVKTTLLFVAASIITVSLVIFRLDHGPFDALAGVLTGLFLVFIFYTVNYRALIIALTKNQLTLSFGLITWAVPIANIADAQLDYLPLLMKYGGAGIHFMFFQKRYRVSFNFLEHPRVAVALKRKVGPVQEVSFSTCHPDEIIGQIRKAMADNLQG